MSPFTYLVDGMMSTGWANAAATRSDVEISVFNPANGTTYGTDARLSVRFHNIDEHLFDLP